MVYSAGGHLALLYSYLINNINIIPIQFVINFVGPIGLHEEYFYRLEKETEPLPSIDNITIIEQAKKDGKIVQFVPSNTLLQFMNAFWGYRYDEKKLNSMLNEDGTIDKENDDYKKMYKVVKHAYVTEINDKYKLPTLCIYGGRDTVVGVSAYSDLKKKQIKMEKFYI